VFADPPPTPPPPKPPYTPPLPDLPIAPGGAFVCNPKSLPSSTFVRDHSLLRTSPPSPPPGAAVATLDIPYVDNRPVVCWRWDEKGLWPPVSSHQDAYEEQEVCGGISAREVRWEDDFRQSKLYDIYRSRLNEDTCRSANDGVCQDGGLGDSRPSRTDYFWKANAMNLLAVSGSYSRWEFKAMEFHHVQPAVGQHIYVHALEQHGQSGCGQTSSRCTSDAFTSHFGESRPGRLVVHVSGTNAEGNERPFFQAESVADEASRNTIDCAVTNTIDCAVVGGTAGCYTDAFPGPCSENIWAVGASDPANCPYGTDRTDCGDRADIVSWGLSAADVCCVEHRWDDDHFHQSDQIAESLAQGFPLSKDGNCNDAGILAPPTLNNLPFITHTFPCLDRRERLHPHPVSVWRRLHRLRRAAPRAAGEPRGRDHAGRHVQVEQQRTL
jgi:hypothetical protein